MSEKSIIPTPTNFIFYSASNGAVKIGVIIQDETVWLTQKQMADLFGVQVPAINKHLNNIFASGELQESAVVSIFEITATDGKTYQAKHYTLDAIISVGYRINSYQATQFRIWATKTLKEFLIKGFVLDDERLKSEEHIKELNRIVSAYLDLAENRAERRIPMRMVDWITFLDRFLELSDYPILTDKGKVSALEAKLRAVQEYDTYRQIQDHTYISDFDKEIKHLRSLNNKDDPTY